MEALLTLIPSEYMEYAGVVLVGLIAVRTTLRTLVIALSEIDVRLDGTVDWQWVGKTSDFLDRVDHVLDLLPVKAPLVRRK